MTEQASRQDQEAERHSADTLRTRLGDAMVLTGPETAPYCRDWHGDVQSDAIAVLRPRSTEEVSQAVRTCAELGLGVIPQGGNTGLALGATPSDSTCQVVLSLERMTRLREIDAENFSAVAEAGIVLQDLKDQVSTQGLAFPLSLGAQGSSRLGGNISTNAGGVNVLRHGMTREMVLDLEVVLPDGSVLDGLSRLRKDNRGLDLKQLFIGTEGTLGIVTAASIKLLPAPEQNATALLALASLSDAIALFRRARRDCCDLMTAFEFMPPVAFELARESIPELHIPLKPDAPAYVLIELSGTGLVDIPDLMERFLEQLFEDGTVRDGVLAQSETQARGLWQIREGMNEGQARRGRHLRTDVSVPLPHIVPFVSETEAAIRAALPDAVCVSYGHVGDGNVHLNVLPAPGLEEGEARTQIARAKEIVTEFVKHHEGSISAEHGIGRLKKAEFVRGISATHAHLIKTIKRSLDPKMVMNPGCQIDFD